MDADGLVVDALIATRARAVLTTPAHQFPTGVALAPHRRRALVAWARERSGLVVEDDYDAEFRYDEHAAESRAAEHGVAVHGMARYRVTGAGPPALVVGYTHLPAQSIGAAVAALAAAVASA